MRDPDLARRDLLKRLGLGAACLPLLGATRARGAPAPRKRLLIIQTAQGYRQASWKPAVGALAAQVLPSSCTPLERWKNQLIFLPDLSNPNIGTTGEGAYGVTFYGLGSNGMGRFREPAGMTLDQVVGTALRTAGQRVSLNLGVQLERPPRATVAPGGNYCFWAGAGMPIKPSGDPVALYHELIAAGSPDPTAARRLMVRRKSILDYVGSNLEEYGKRLGTDDRAAVEGHLQSVRDLEGQLQSPSAGLTCDVRPAPETIDLADPASYPRILDAHLGLMVMALRCGLTSVATLQTSEAGARNIDVGFVPGIPSLGGASGRRTLRDISQNPIYQGSDWKRIVDQWFMSRLAALLEKLDASLEEGRSMLDSTVVLIGNHVQDGANQDAQKLPWMLAGNCGGYLDSGRCLPSAGRTTASVMAGLCEALGVTHPYGAAMAELRKV
jgi:hypothetical protein